MAAAVDLLKQSYDHLKQSIYADLAFQTRLKPYVESITLDDTVTGKSLNFNSLIAKFERKLGADHDNAVIDLIELITYYDGLLKVAGPNFIAVFPTG